PRVGIAVASRNGVRLECPPRGRLTGLSAPPPAPASPRERTGPGGPRAGGGSGMSFRGVFLTVFLGTALMVGAFMVHARRPAREPAEPPAALARATGKCAECHRHETSAVVHEYEMSRHNEAGVNCLDCHKGAPGQQTVDHRGFTIATKVTAASCS